MASPSLSPVVRRLLIGALVAACVAIAAVSTLVVVVSRVPAWQYEHRWAAVVVPFLPYAVVGWAVVAGLLVLLLRGGWKVAAVFPLAWAVALGASVPYAEPAASAPNHSADLRVVTANLYYGWGNGDDVWRAVTGSDADVVVLQEVTVQTAFIEAPAWRERYPYRVGRVGADWASDEVMVFSRRPMAEVDRRPNVGLPYVVRVETPHGPVTVGTAHLANPWSDHAGWVHEWEGLRVWASAQQGATALVGDFNTTLDHDPMRRLLSEGWADAGVQTGGGWQPTYGPAYANAPGRTLPAILGIDHVLVRAGMNAIDVRTGAISGSDHRSLAVGLSLTE